MAFLFLTFFNFWQRSTTKKPDTIGIGFCDAGNVFTFIRKCLHPSNIVVFSGHCLQVSINGVNFLFLKHLEFRHRRF